MDLSDPPDCLLFFFFLSSSSQEPGCPLLLDWEEATPGVGWGLGCGGPHPRTAFQKCGTPVPCDMNHEAGEHLFPLFYRLRQRESQSLPADLDGGPECPVCVAPGEAGIVVLLQVVILQPLLQALLSRSSGSRHCF